MIRARASLFGVLFLLGGCVYYNSIYNAERALAEAEQHRRAGRDSAAAASYTEVIRKAARGYRADPLGEWSFESLLLLGRAHLGLGEVRSARAALDAASQRTAYAAAQPDLMVYRALAAYAAGEVDPALLLVNSALRGPLSPEALADGHLLRARILLARGRVEEGWWNLDRAAAVGPERRLEAALDRVRWAIGTDRPKEAGEGFRRLLRYREAGTRIDTLTVLAERSAGRWGPAGAAGFLAGADSARWGRVERDRIRLVRSRLLQAAGDTAEAAAVAWSVARGVGLGAAEGRVLLARRALAETGDLAGLARVRAMLLPVADYAPAEGLLEAITEVDAYASVGLDVPLGWFAAAEIARDRLGADLLAKGLFLAYADATPSGAWAAKALLAALDGTDEERDRAWLRERLNAHRDSPYVHAARGEAAPGFEALEEELSLRLREMRGR